MIIIAGPGDPGAHRRLVSMMRHAKEMPNSLDIVLQKSSLAERRVRECRKIVEQQRASVAKYKAADRDASSSEALLSEIQKSLDAFEKDYRSIQAELEALRGHNDAAPPTLTQYLGRRQVV
jgi:septal ring factor EnvC (AmiA/AmiB activator)